MPASGKQRLDVRLHELGLSESREQGRRLIMAGEVTVDGATVDRPAAAVSAGAQIALKRKPRFVSRGGEKLAAALAAFGLDVTGWVCADLGASTGGFTDVLLQRGAARVYAIDVGHGILDYRLRIDPRVVVREKTNARYLATLPEPVRLVSIDASFISLKLLLPVARGWLAGAAGEIVTLIKPQFEAGRKLVGKGGLVKDPAVHRQVLADVLGWAAANGLPPAGLLRSPITGAEGNVEFLAWLRPGSAPALDLPAAIERGLSA
ncbi:MAG: TlyA family RNA methyltransferase [Anaerolineales bacterium]|nr:TlyA family RNA methyltransferase [Anaerolineales bacterium]